jgi:hypothetical protein
MARRLRSRTLHACGTLLALLLASSSAQAAGATVSNATQAQKDEALKHFKAGGQASHKRQFTRAVTEYRASLDMVDSPNARLELARALRDGGQSGEAYNEYGRTIDAGKALAAEEARYGKTAEVAMTERSELERKIGFLTVLVEHAPQGATLTVGAAAVSSDSWGKPVPVTPGSVDIVLTAGGAEVARKSMQVSAGETAAASIDGKAPEPPPAETKPPPVATAPTTPQDRLEVPPPSDAEIAAARRPPPPPPPSGATKLRPFAYIAGGVGLAGIATFAIFGSMSHSAFNDLQSTCHGVCPPGHESQISSGRTEQTVANIGLVVGAVGVAAGVALFIISMPRSAQPSGPSTALVLGPGWLGVRGSL